MTLDNRMYWYKKLAEWSAVFALGLWLGVNHVAKHAYPKGRMVQEPAWADTAREVAYASIVLFAIGVFGWILLSEIERRLLE